MQALKIGPAYLGAVHDLPLFQNGNSAAFKFGTAKAILFVEPPVGDEVTNSLKAEGALQGLHETME
jgi:hypothetical protein